MKDLMNGNLQWIMLDWLQKLNWYEYGVALAILLGFLLFRKIFTTYIFKIILRYSQNVNIDILTYILKSFERPLRFVFIIIGMYFSLTYLTVTDPYDETIALIVRLFIILSVTWGLYNLSDESSTLLESFTSKIGFNLDKILLPFFSKLLRLIILALALVIVLDQLGIRVDGFIAGIGLGGLAFSLAAQETIKNFFGGLVIITEKPFSIGDWIETPSVEGTIEDINFRSTKIRTFAQALVTVPNSTLANEPITNWTRMGRRRVMFHLGVTYTTQREKLKRSVDRIRDMLFNHPEINNEVLFVHFDRFNNSSLDIFLYFFTNTTVWGEWLKVKEDCNLKIMEILEEEGVSIAFPSRSIYLESKPDASESEVREAFKKLRESEQTKSISERNQNESEMKINEGKGNKTDFESTQNIVQNDDIGNTNEDV